MWKKSKSKKDQLTIVYENLREQFVNTGTHTKQMTLSRVEYWDLWLELQSKGLAVLGKRVLVDASGQSKEYKCIVLFGPAEYVDIYHD